MKRVSKLFTGFLILSLCIAFTSNYLTSLSPKEVNFIIKGPFGKKVHGRFEKITTDVHFNPKDPSGAVFSASLQVADINTGNKKRDGHLMKDDFFNEPQFPAITFNSTSVKVQGTQWLLEGNLLMHGQSRPVSIPFTFSETQNEFLFKGEFKLDRTDFAVGKKSPLIGEEVIVVLNVPVEKR